MNTNRKLIIGFWISFNNELKNTDDLSRLQSFYNGYAFGLFKSNRINKEQYDKIIQRIINKILIINARKRYESKKQIDNILKTIENI